MTIAEFFLHFAGLFAFILNTFRAAWFRQFSQKKQQFSVALPTP